MRPLTADLFATVDGYASGEGTSAFFGYPGPDLDQWVQDELAKPQVVLIGRVTYQAMAGISAAGTDPISTKMTELPRSWSHPRSPSPCPGPTPRPQRQRTSLPSQGRRGVGIAMAANGTRRRVAR
jgi:hypothetical protein